MQMRTVTLVLFVAACGGSPKQGTWHVESTRSERTIDKWTEADEDTHIGLACKNIVGPDGALRCPALERAGISATRCPASMNTLRTSANDDKQREAFRLIVAGLSLADSCEMVDATFRIAARSLKGTGEAGAKASPGADGACKRSDMFGPFELSGEDMLKRRGLGDRSFADTQSSPDAPIQVCGVRGELTWLMNATCADGSRPFGRDVAKAHGARQGSSTGMRSCGATTEPVPVDHYTVPCPEKQYDVFMDMYECGPGEQFE